MGTSNSERLLGKQGKVKVNIALVDVEIIDVDEEVECDECDGPHVEVVVLETAVVGSARMVTTGTTAKGCLKDVILEEEKANDSGEASASHVRLNTLVSGKAREVAETINGSDNYMLSTDMIEHMIMVYAEQVAKAQREICAEAYFDAEGKGNDEVDRPNEGTYRHIKNAPDPAL